MVKATDPFGSEVEAQVTVTVTDVNEAPSVTGAASIDHTESNDPNTVAALDPNMYTVTDADEDDDVDADADVKWSLSGADESKFNITGTGDTGDMRTLAFKANPDYESPGDSGANNLYEVTVVVTDTKGNTDQLTVMVKVTNVEEMGSIEFSTLQPRVGFPVTATLTDQDNVNEDSLEWQWYRDANFEADNIPDVDEPADECTATKIDDCFIAGATSATYTPATSDADQRLTAVASYTDGNANMDDAKDVVVERGENDVLESTVNQAPAFPDQDDDTEGSQTAQERMIAENTASGMQIGVE